MTTGLYFTAIAYGLVLVGLALAGCEPGQARELAATAQGREGEPELWEVMEKGEDSTHPLYLAQEIFTLPDGTQVACLAHRNGLWCKEMDQGTRSPRKTQKPQASPQAPETPSEGLDFGG